jgi:hypothetical protein
MASAALAFVLPLSDANADLTAWNHWKLPAITEDITFQGPILVTVEYDVAPEHVQDFIKLIHEYGRIRRRDGASRWGVCKDLEIPHRYLETFVVSSWAEHLRQHDRLTITDSHLEDRLQRYSRKEPQVRHLLYL